MPSFGWLIICLPFLFTQLTADSDGLRMAAYWLWLGYFYTSTGVSQGRWLPLDLALVLIWLQRVVSSGVGTADLWYCFPWMIWESSLLLGYLSLRHLRFSKKNWDALGRGLLYSLFLACVCQGVMPEEFKPLTQGRFNAQLFHPNLLAIFAVIALTLTDRESRIFPALLLLTLALVVLSGSRTGMVCVLIFLALSARKQNLVWISLALLLATAAFMPDLGRNVLEKYRLGWETTLGIRQGVFESSINALRQNPFGMGTGLYAERITPYLSPILFEYFPNPRQQSLTNAHNIFLHLAVESGLLILAPLVILFALVMKQGKSESGLLIWAVSACVDVHFLQPASQLLLILLLLHWRQHLSPHPVDPSLRRPAYFIPCFLWILAALHCHSQLRQKELHLGLQAGIASDEMNSRRELSEANPWVWQRSRLEVLRLLAALGAKDFKLARNLGEEMSQRFPGYYLVEATLSETYLHLQELDLALISIEQAIDFHPLEESNYQIKAKILSALGKTAAAQEARNTYMRLLWRNSHFREDKLNWRTQEK